MISQRCPKCGSSRVRHGYTPTPIWSKFLFRYNLLCDACNWEFKGFAVPGTVSTKPRRKAKKNVEKTSAEFESVNVTGDTVSGDSVKIKRKRVKL
jgi:ribosomal protein L37AE/L43A